MTEQKTKTYIPRISYKGKILLLFFIIVLTLTSCNAQKSTTTKPKAVINIAVDSIAYDIIEDSTLCVSYDKKNSWYVTYKVPFFKVKADIQKIKAYSFFNKDKLKKELRASIESIKKDCDIFCNQKNIVSMTIMHEDSNARNYPLYYFNYAVNNKSLNINTGDSFNIKIIDENAVSSSLRMINSDIKKIITDALLEYNTDDFGEEVTQSDKEYIKKNYYKKNIT